MKSQEIINDLNHALTALRDAGIYEGPAYDSMRDKITQVLDEEAREADRKMMMEENEDLFSVLFNCREQLRWATRCGGDQEWMQEQRMEAMMLGEWDWESQAPSW